MNNASSSSTSTSQVFSDNDSETSPVFFVQDGKTFFPLGGTKPICVVPDIFREEVRVNIREYFSFREDSSFSSSTPATTSTDFLYPTKRGVSLTIEEFNVLCDNIESVKQNIKKLKKQLRKSSKQQQQKKKKNKSSTADNSDH